MSSNAPGYTASDELAAKMLRERLLESDPSVLRLDNVGGFPNNAIFHAETNALIRASGLANGSLAGRSIDMYVDRPLCESCSIVLPSIGRQLGNPTVRIIDGDGDVWIMRDGIWLRMGR